MWTPTRSCPTSIRFKEFPRSNILATRRRISQITTEGEPQMILLTTPWTRFNQRSKRDKGVDLLAQELRRRKRSLVVARKAMLMRLLSLIKLTLMPWLWAQKIFGSLNFMLHGVDIARILSHIGTRLLES